MRAPARRLRSSTVPDSSMVRTKDLSLFRVEALMECSHQEGGHVVVLDRALEEGMQESLEGSPVYRTAIALLFDDPARDHGRPAPALLAITS